jgi:4-hydroxysphinganine ceramide fatty acyl 2-hydroxylase
MKRIGRLERPQASGSAQLFESPVLEKMSRTHISIPIALFFIISTISGYYGYTHTTISLLSAFGIFMLGWLVFTLVEYVMHRYLFHMEPDSPVKDRVQYTMHGVHHDYPRDKDRLAMPPYVSLLYTALFYGGFRLIMGDAAFFFLPGFLTGYAMYLAVHYVVHAYQPPKNFLKVLWVNHGIHHYKDPDKAFGVSSPLWDYIFGTMPK